MIPSVSIDAVRNQMTKVALQKDVFKQKNKKGIKKSSFDVAHKHVSPELADHQQFLCTEGRLLDMLHSGNTLTNQVNIAKFIKLEVPTSKSSVLINMTQKQTSFRIYCRDTSTYETFESYRTSDFQCIQQILNVKVPVVLNDNTRKKHAILCQWKPLFGFIPVGVVGIPIKHSDKEVGSIVAISFKQKIPKEFLDKRLTALEDSLQSLVPYAFINQGIVDSNNAVTSFKNTFECLEKIEKVIGSYSPTTAITQIGTEISQLGGSKGLVTFTVDDGENMLRKFQTNSSSTGKTSCPNKLIHKMSEIPLSNEVVAALAWVAANAKGMRFCNATDLADIGIDVKTIHSIGNCNTKSMIIVPVVDYSGENSLVIELSDNSKVFNHRDFEAILLFCQHVATLLTTTLLLDRREKNFRRKNILNEVLCSISFVKLTNVEQFISHHRRTSTLYRGNFDQFNLCIRSLPEQDISGIALEIFYALHIVSDFKIRRNVLVRFIMSVQQGYGHLPYHNWNHAISVAHYTYLLIKKLKLVQLGHLTKLEAFALVVSALTHDIDHRGTNNQFQSYTNSEIYKLYACEDSVMERHHLSIALAILHKEDCNILESFNDTDYKEFVELLTWNIIATDISKHLKIRQGLFNEAKSVNPHQRKMARLSLFMTAADLCDNCKNWDDNLPTVKGILQEFFNQGDMEKQLGFTPIPMMDRQAAYIPLIEYKFVKFIVAPVYIFLASIYQELKPCVDNILKNEDLWTISTIVFDELKDKTKDQLDILDVSSMKEEALLAKQSTISLEEIRLKKFSVPAAPASQTNPAELKRNSLALFQSLQVSLDEVDTGETKKSKFPRLFCCCARK